MPRFKALAGKGAVEGVPFVAGDEIETEIELDKKFQNKFQRIGEGTKRANDHSNVLDQAGRVSDDAPHVAASKTGKPAGQAFQNKGDAAKRTVKVEYDPEDGDEAADDNARNVASANTQDPGDESKGGVNANAKSLDKVKAAKASASWAEDDADEDEEPEPKDEDAEDEEEEDRPAPKKKAKPPVKKGPKKHR